MAYVIGNLREQYPESRRRVQMVYNEAKLRYAERAIRVILSRAREHDGWSDMRRVRDVMSASARRGTGDR